jgi:transcriptional regulator with PAS, ATPase and Fis domain
MQQMMQYPWPGNVRELENEIERLVVLAGDAPTISEALLSPRIRQFTPDPEVATGDLDSLPAAVEALERKMIGAAMRRHNGNKTRAAEELKVSRRNLIRLVQKYELE